MSRGRPKLAAFSPRRAGPDAASPRHFVTALARGLEVLASFRKGETLLGNSEIAARCGLPKSTVSRLTYTLSELGYLHYVEAVSKYRLGTSILALGTSMLARLDVRSIARPLMEEIAATSKVSVALGARDRLSMVYIEAFRGYTPVSLALDVGARISISTSAMGRAFLAACNESVREAVFEEIRALSDENWPATQAAILRSIACYREKGCACSFGEWQPNVNAIAVGFEPGGGLPPMAINCGAPDTVATPDFLMEEVRPRLIALARGLDGAMGF
jgi:DNA-binding IclR family transcriptional regulator